MHAGEHARSYIMYMLYAVHTRAHARTYTYDYRRFLFFTEPLPVRTNAGAVVGSTPHTARRAYESASASPNATTTKKEMKRLGPKRQRVYTQILSHAHTSSSTSIYTDQHVCGSQTHIHTHTQLYMHTHAYIQAQLTYEVNWSDRKDGFVYARSHIRRRRRLRRHRLAGTRERTRASTGTAATAATAAHRPTGRGFDAYHRCRARMECAVAAAAAV